MPRDRPAEAGHVRDITVQVGRSKKPVVRLEPFFRKAPVALPRPCGTMLRNPRLSPVQAAFVAGRVAAAADSNRTLTRFETPDSSIVTP